MMICEIGTNVGMVIMGGYEITVVIVVVGLESLIEFTIGISC